jgi:hypothetical protein
MTRALLTSRTARVAAAAALGLSLTLTAAPGQAAPLSGKSWVASPNGIVGVQQQVILRAPALAGQVGTFTFTTPAGASNAGQAAVNSAGFAYLPWTPNIAGAWTITATGGGATLDTASITVVAVPTVTGLQVQNEVQQGEPATIVVDVQALTGSIAPSGTVTVRTTAGASVATGTLRPSGVTGESIAELSWTPGAGTTSMVATFTPANANFGASTSNTQSPVSGPAQAVSIRMPGTMYVGVPERVSAVINRNFENTTGGSVAFNLSINGVTSYPMGGSRGVVDRVGSAIWTPTNAGVQTVNVEYASLNFQFNGNDSQVINVQSAPTNDTITVTPSGAAAWAPGVPVSMVARTAVTVSGASTSGNPVTFAVAGPCALEGASLTALGAGACTVTAISMGNGGNLKGTTATYTVNVTPAPKKKRR